MAQISLLKPFLAILLIAFSVRQVTPGLYVTSPTMGQIVSGTVEISGSMPDDGFSYGEISYSFSDSLAPNWFLIERMEEPVHDEILARWDTTIISDGEYRLKVSVHRRDGSSSDLIIEKILVGNYTHYDATATPQQAAAISTPAETATATVQVNQRAQPTALPENPASIQPGEIRKNLLGGLILAVLVLGTLGIYSRFRNMSMK